MGRRYDHSREELRRLILDAARELVLADGPAAMTARAVAKRIGYAPGTLYTIFRNLDDLVLQLNGETLAELGERLDALDGADPARRLHDMADAYLGFARERRPLWQLLFEYTLEPGAELPGWYVAGIGALIAKVEAAVDETGLDLAPAARRNAAFALFSAIHGVCVLLIGRGYRAFESYDANALVHGLIDAAVAGWRAGPRN